VLEQLDDPRQAPGADAMAFLARHGHEAEVLAAVEKTISGDDERRRDEAYLALGQIGTARAKELLLAGLDREHGERRQTAIVAIGLTGDPSLVSKIAKFANTQGLVTATIEALGKLGGEKAIEVVSGFADHDESLVRAYAVEAMLRAGAPADAVSPALDGLVQDADPGVRQLIALRLGGVDHALAREALERLAADGERDVRLEALRSLLLGATPEQVDVFLAGAADTDYEVQAVALEGLGRVAGPDVIATTLEPLFDAPIPYVRIAAASAVVEILARPPAS
jgi:HEAT repeat protein